MPPSSASDRIESSNYLTAGISRSEATTTPEQHIEKERSQQKRGAHARAEANPAGVGDFSPNHAIKAMRENDRPAGSAMHDMLPALSIGGLEPSAHGKRHGLGQGGTDSPNGTVPGAGASRTPLDNLAIGSVHPPVADHGSGPPATSYNQIGANPPETTLASGSEGPPHTGSGLQDNGANTYTDYSGGVDTTAGTTDSPQAAYDRSQVSDRSLQSSDRTTASDTKVRLGDQTLNFPTRDDLYNKPVSELRATMNANQRSLENFDTAHKSAIPLIGFHGAKDSNLKAFMDKGRSSNGGTYFGTSASKAADSPTAVSDLEHAAKFASTYATPFHYEPREKAGGVAVFNLNKYLGGGSQNGLRGDVDPKSNYGSEVLDAAIPKNVAEFSTNLNSEDFQTTFKGVVPYESYSQFDKLYENPMQSFEAFERFQIAESLKIQKIVADGLKLATDN